MATIKDFVFSNHHFDLMVMLNAIFYVQLTIAQMEPHVSCGDDSWAALRACILWFCAINRMHRNLVVDWFIGTTQCIFRHLRTLLFWATLSSMFGQTEAICSDFILCVLVGGLELFPYIGNNDPN